MLAMHTFHAHIGPDRLNPRQGSETSVATGVAVAGGGGPDRLNPRQGSETKYSNTEKWAMC